jgi:lysyl-tRNA synthetase class II
MTVLSWAGWQVFQIRAKIINYIRRFLDERGFLVRRPATP